VSVIGPPGLTVFAPGEVCGGAIVSDGAFCTVVVTVFDCEL
jgi:hypothetical protein